MNKNENSEDIRSKERRTWSSEQLASVYNNEEFARPLFCIVVLDLGVQFDYRQHSKTNNGKIECRTRARNEEEEDKKRNSLFLFSEIE